MERRRFLGLAVGSVAAVVTGALVHEPASAVTYGLVDAGAPEYDYKRPFRCFLDGVDVTSRARRANDREGWADLFDEPRRVVGNEVMLHRYYGDVRLVQKA